MFCCYLHGCVDLTLLSSCLFNDANCCSSTAHLSLTILHNRRLISCKSQHGHVCLKREDKGAPVASAPPGLLTRIRTRRSCCRSGVGTWARGRCTRTPRSQSRPSRSPWGTVAGSSVPGPGRSRLKEHRWGVGHVMAAATIHHRLEQRLHVAAPTPSEATFLNYG